MDNIRNPFPSCGLLGHGKEVKVDSLHHHTLLTACCAGQHQQMEPLLCEDTQQINGLSGVCLFFFYLLSSGKVMKRLLLPAVMGRWIEHNLMITRGFL